MNNSDLHNSTVSEAITDTQLRSAPDVQGVNLSGNNLSGFDLAGLDLGVANLDAVNLTNADLSAANISAATFHSDDLTGTDLRNGNISRAITDTQLQSALAVVGINLSGNDLGGFNLSGLDLSNADLSFSRVSDVDLSSADLNSTNLSHVDLRSSDLAAANLTNTNLHQAILPSSMPSLPVIAGAVVSVDNPLAVSGLTTVDNGGVLSINTTGFTSAGLDLRGGTVIAATGYDQGLNGHGTVLGNITGAADKVIPTSGGTLTLGDANSSNGFDFAGTLDAGPHQVILSDADTTTLGALSKLAAGGRLNTANGAGLGPNNSLIASGTATVDGDFTNNGQVDGTAGAGEFLIFTGDVGGEGSYTGNIQFSDGFNPGSRPAAVSFDNMAFDGTA